MGKVKLLPQYLFNSYLPPPIDHISLYNGHNNQGCGYGWSYPDPTLTANKPDPDPTLEKIPVLT